VNGGLSSLENLAAIVGAEYLGSGGGLEPGLPLLADLHPCQPLIFSRVTPFWNWSSTVRLPSFINQSTYRYLNLFILFYFLRKCF